MPIEIDRKLIKEEVYIKSSPVFELASAFHVLVVPEHHGFLSQWTDDMKAKLTEEESDILALLSKTYSQGHEVISCVFDIGEFDNCDRFLDKFNSYDMINFLYSFFEENVSRESINDCVNSPGDSFEILRKEVGDFIGIREIAAYAGIVERRYVVHRGINSIFKKICSMDFFEILEGQNENYITQIQSITQKLETEIPLDIAQEIMGKKFHRVSSYSKYYFIPSYFIYPHNIRIFNNEALVLIFSYGSDVSSQEKMVEKIDSSLRVISDKTRLRILKQLISGKSYGKVIASRLKLTTATISHHLDILKDAGFVEEERTKNVKYFSCNVSKVEEVIYELEDYLFNKN